MSKDDKKQAKSKGAQARKPYAAPDFIASLAFERQSLSCSAGPLTNSTVFPANCLMSS
jgi:hypothetical protein